MEVRRFRVCGRPGGEIIQSAVDGAPLGYDSREAPRLLALGFARGPLCRTARIGSSGSGGFGSGGGSGSGPGIGGVGCGVGSGGGNGLGSGDMHAVSPRGGSGKRQLEPGLLSKKCASRSTARSCVGPSGGPSSTERMDSQCLLVSPTLVWLVTTASCGRGPSLPPVRAP